VKRKTYKPLILGTSIAIIASIGYALISPKNIKDDYTRTSLAIPAIRPESVTVAINNPVLSTAAATVTSEVAQAEPITFVHKIKQGENLSTIFSNLDLSKTDLHSITHASEIGKQFASITPGKDLVVSINTEGLLQQLVYKKNSIDTLKADRSNDGFNVKIISKLVERKVTSTQATINSSLFLDGKDAGLSDKLIMQLADIFAWDIDFALSLRKGDQFTVVYEKIFVDGKEIDTGNIISAEFVNQSHPYTAVRFEDKKGTVNYFTPDGKSMRKAFLRTPVDFARISSHFNLKRKHPVLNRIRAHKGVDYAARSGTPIKTTGNGKIVFRGRKGGYGRVVIVKHGQKYSTLYAHMSRYKKGQKVGSRVKQGQTIGYVGKSGLATGAHLHYEFRINGIHRNPLTVKLPHSLPIKKSLLAEFKKQTTPLITQLNKVKAKSLLAQNKH
jgi:murein DD-endopeptidase MepM/ murein hydrolase activator NlpD